MPLLTVARAVALLATVLCGWSLNLRWGESASLGAGPPMQWERQVVGATLLAAFALACLVIGGRRAGGPAIAARVLAPAAALGAVALALWMRRDAARGFVGLVAGPGWPCLAVGAGLALLAALGFQVVRRPAPALPARPARRRRSQPHRR